MTLQSPLGEKKEEKKRLGRRGREGEDDEKEREKSVNFQKGHFCHFTRNLPESHHRWVDLAEKLFIANF